jgi:hypothetical protein
MGVRKITVKMLPWVNAIQLMTRREAEAAYIGRHSRERLCGNHRGIELVQIYRST